MLTKTEQTFLRCVKLAKLSDSSSYQTWCSNQTIKVSMHIRVEVSKKSNLNRRSDLSSDLTKLKNLHFSFTSVSHRTYKELTWLSLWFLKYTVNKCRYTHCLLSNNNIIKYKCLKEKKKHFFKLFCSQSTNNFTSKLKLQTKSDGAKQWPIVCPHHSSLIATVAEIS